MNREIKFRAWHRIDKTMLPLDAIDWGEKWVSHEDRPFPGREPPHHDSMSNLADVEIMQFTGLKDKNGVEIYEGSIIRFGWNPILHDESEILEFCASVIFDEGWACFAVVIHSKRGNEEKVSVGQLASQETGRAEVIGNIYEHPHLLENKNVG